MWSRWARRSRLTGLAFLTGAAVAIAAAALLWVIGVGWLTGVLAAFSCALIVHAGFDFHTAHKYERLAR